MQGSRRSQHLLKHKYFSRYGKPKHFFAVKLSRGENESGNGFFELNVLASLSKGDEDDAS